MVDNAPTSQPNKWKNRIVGYGEENPDQLLSHPLNPKIHPQAQQDALDGALTELGWLMPVVVNRTTGHLLDGHARVGKAISLGERSVPVAYVEIDADEEAAALATIDPIGSMAVYDRDMLESVLADAHTDSDAVQGMWDDLLDGLPKPRQLTEGGGGDSEDTEPQLDRADELAATWGTAEGQLWVIPSLSVPGKSHRLVIGDSRDKRVLARLCPPDGVTGIFTSPPYAEQRKGEYGGIPAASYHTWWDGVQRAMVDVLAEDGSFFVNIRAHTEKKERSLYVYELVIAMGREWDWHLIDDLCWVRPSIPGLMGARFKNEWEGVYHFSRTLDPKWRPENVIEDADLSGAKTYAETDGSVTLGSHYAGRGGDFVRSANFEGALPGNVLSVSRGFSVNPGHGAIFPEALPAFFMRAYSDVGDVWLDPFCGSGTVIVSAEKTRRVACAAEVLPKYAAVILERCRDAGMEPKLEENA